MARDNLRHGLRPYTHSNMLHAGAWQVGSKTEFLTRIRRIALNDFWSEECMGKTFIVKKYLSCGTGLFYLLAPRTWILKT